MSLDTAADTAVAELTKLAVLQAWGLGGKAGARLKQLLTRKKIDDQVDTDELERQLRAAVAADPEWSAEISAVLAELGSDRPAPRCERLPRPLRDRHDALGAIGDSGVWVVSGRPGIGRRTLTLGLAERRAEQFHGGSLAVDLDEHRGEDGELVVRDAQRHILRQCGIPAADQATTAADVDTQYRTELAHRRMLLIVHNVAGAAELAPFEPATRSALLIATTTTPTDDLVVRYGHRNVIHLDGLDEDGARELLADVCDPALLAAEPEAADELVELCDRRPDALGYAGARLRRSRGTATPVAALVRRLRDRGVTDALQMASDAVDEYLGGLSERDAADVRLLATHPGRDLDADTASALLGHDATDILADLGDAGLLTTIDNGDNGDGNGSDSAGRDPRVRLHHDVRDLVLHREGDDAAVDEAFARTLRYFRDCAVHADLDTDVDPKAGRLRVYPEGWGERPRGGEPLLPYLDRRRHILLELARQGRDRGYATEVCQLGGALEVLATTRGMYEWYIQLGEACCPPPNSSATRRCSPARTRCRAAATTSRA
ncbi:hypothetical protein BJF85_23665 [Saccharomonospora sp. CUA-673]|uniref:hypothetical protein n=1 Tax=Saccharomonospora sp. CUA-673 TaxID=1904969 RepID=UPI0009694D77|nr:hypothetical protein [Saccharomonospora sp. CUA-673]OLT41566.1 hypothetical protein BJF85_23665 [Saccharomonospora sp. CUA-673]